MYLQTSWQLVCWWYIVWINDICVTNTSDKKCNIIWVRTRNCGCLVTWFCYRQIAKPGNKTATVRDLTHLLLISITSLCQWPTKISKRHISYSTLFLMNAKQNAIIGISVMSFFCHTQSYDTKKCKYIVCSKNSLLTRHTITRQCYDVPQNCFYIISECLWYHSTGSLAKCTLYISTG